jgi:hypothetical protein
MKLTLLPVSSTKGRGFVLPTATVIRMVPSASHAVGMSNEALAVSDGPGGKTPRTPRTTTKVVEMLVEITAAPVRPACAPLARCVVMKP